MFYTLFHVHLAVSSAMTLTPPWYHIQLLWPTPQRVTQFKGDKYVLRSSLEVYFAPHSTSDMVHIDWIWDYLRYVAWR